MSPRPDDGTTEGIAHRMWSGGARFGFTVGVALSVVVWAAVEVWR